MTKKRFYKLFRAWCSVQPANGADSKAMHRLCNKQPGMHPVNGKTGSYAQCWAIITHDGKYSDGVGVKTK